MSSFSDRQNPPDLKTEALGLVLILSSSCLFLALYSYDPNDPSWSHWALTPKVQNACGWFGSFLSDGLFKLFGFGAWTFPVVLFAKGIIGLLTPFYRKSVMYMPLRWFIFFQIWTVSITELHKIGWPPFPMGGGFIGASLVQLLTRWTGALGSILIIWGFFILSLNLFWGLSVVKIFSFFFQNLGKLLGHLENLTSQIRLHQLSPLFIEGREFLFFGIDSERQEKQIVSAPTVKVSYHANPAPALDVHKKEDLPKNFCVPERLLRESSAFKEKKEVLNSSLGHWRLPSLDVLEPLPQSRINIDPREIREQAQALIEKLRIFGIKGEMVRINTGPAVTLFEFRPESSVKISKITELADDLAMALASESLRIMAPIPGRDVVGIETAHKKREIVFLREILEEEKFWSNDYLLPFGLGKSVDGRVEIADLRKIPHLLVAGTTGSGKSVFTVSLISSLIFKHSPETLRLLLVDPKQVDLSAFENLPHLVSPLITDARQAVVALRWSVGEMEKRYRAMSLFSARGLEDYNKKVLNLSDAEKQKLLEDSQNFGLEVQDLVPFPYLVIVVEEFADLMCVDKGQVENAVIRLAQKARACGIHLILCLQSPRKEFVTGAIKSNIPGRIAFKAASSMESRIILDETGAERLLTSGDMLYRGPGLTHLVRHHGPFFSERDIKSLCSFWESQGETQFLISFDFEMNNQNSQGNRDSLEDDRLPEVLNWLKTQKEVSASLLQRRFGLGYPRAARIIEILEAQGVISPPRGSKPRLVMINEG